MAEEAYANHRSVLIKLLNDPFAAARHPGKLKKRGSKEEDATDHENGNGDAHEMHSQVGKCSINVLVIPESGYRCHTRFVNIMLARCRTASMLVGRL